MTFFQQAYNNDGAKADTEAKKTYPEPEPTDASKFWV
jgi:hypothetical protein